MDHFVHDSDKNDQTLQKTGQTDEAIITMLSVAVAVVNFSIDNDSSIYPFAYKAG